MPLDAPSPDLDPDAPASYSARIARAFERVGPVAHVTTGRWSGCGVQRGVRPGRLRAHQRPRWSREAA